MRELVSRCLRGPRSDADVGREVLASEGGTGGDEVGGCALEDDPAAVVAGEGYEDTIRRGPATIRWRDRWLRCDAAAINWLTA